MATTPESSEPTGAGPALSDAALPQQTGLPTVNIDSTITHPGSVRINVQGAFIVDHESYPPSGSRSPTSRADIESKDIRLPNHTAVVSHIAIDVCP